MTKVIDETPMKIVVKKPKVEVFTSKIVVQKPEVVDTTPKTIRFVDEDNQ